MTGTTFRTTLIRVREANVRRLRDGALIAHRLAKRLCGRDRKNAYVVKARAANRLLARGGGRLGEVIDNGSMILIAVPFLRQPWCPYFMRWLAEGPANVMLLLRHCVTALRRRPSCRSSRERGGRAFGCHYGGIREQHSL
jgi:hypothetical protein